MATVPGTIQAMNPVGVAIVPRMRRRRPRPPTAGVECTAERADPMVEGRKRRTPESGHGLRHRLHPPFVLNMVTPSLAKDEMTMNWPIRTDDPVMSGCDNVVVPVAAGPARGAARAAGGHSISPSDSRGR